MQGLTLIPELYYKDLPANRKKNVRNFEAPYPVREISMVYHRPYAKSRLIDALTKEIKHIISPLLQTTQLKSNEMMIAAM
jgi:LysR family hydrogen peroxide-inducible transcriptional activator